jgi:hypothetical protein
MTLDLSELETDALATLLRRTINDDKYPLSPRIQILKTVLNKIQPEPERAPLPPGARVRATAGRREASSTVVAIPKMRALVQV